MRSAILLFCAPVLFGADPDLRLIVVDPVHFHAAQLHTKPMRGFARDASVYAPVGKELAGYFNFVSNLKARSAQSDYWRFHIYSGDDFFDRMLKERPGEVVVLSGRNWKNIDYIGKSVAAGLHVLADKPWIIDTGQFPALEQVFTAADSKRLIAYDCMTQRFDIAYILERELVNDPGIFGSAITGTPDQPAVEMASTHFLLKRFNGVPNLRPAAYFDIRQQGEAFADVGTHVVDLAHWTLFPDQALDYKKDFRILSARRWPTVLTLDDFTKVTGDRDFPSYLQPDIREGKLHYFTNNSVVYSARGHVVKLSVTWDFESPSGASDTMLAMYRGAKSEVMARQSAEEKYVPEVYVTPRPQHRASVLDAVDRRLAKLASRYPGLSRSDDKDGRIRIVIPQTLRIPDIEYFLLLAEKFAGYIQQPGTLPAWERPNMLAKYWVTTQGVKAAREAQ
jgi:predicted dehydrogenase